MGKTPDITVVVPLYNKEKYIERSVRSVLAQTHADFELIVVNDGSTDQSLKILEKISDGRLRVITQPNKGVSAARNCGILNARAELIAFLDADDEWLPNMIETLLRLQRNFPEAGAYATSYQIAEEGEIKIRSAVGIPAHPWEGIIPNYFYALLNSPNEPSNSSSTAFCRQVFDKVGFFPEGERQGEDVDMFCRVAIKYPFAMSTQVCSTYYIDTENSGSRAWHERYAYIDTIRTAYQEGKIPAHMREDALEYAAGHEINSAYRHLEQGEIKLARQMLLANRSKRFRKNKWRVLLMTFEHISIVKWGLCGARYIRGGVKQIIHYPQTNPKT